MADTSVFSRLRRLFSTDVVIRNTGGNQLKVMDINQIQQAGEVRTNSLVDRFTRLRTTNAGPIYNPAMNYQTLRTQLYSDYEAMDTDAIIASALDIVSDESTLKNEMSEVLTIRSSAEKIQKKCETYIPEIRVTCKWGTKVQTRREQRKRRSLPK